MTKQLAFDVVYGLDFSGARLAGKNAWLSEVRVERAGLQLVSLGNLESRAGTAERADVMAWLVAAVRRSERALWAIDAPFGLPVELFGAGWPAQLEFVGAWDGTAITLGRHLAQRALAEQGVMHVRRRTDREQKTPFDCYHYRIVHQTFHAMRDVLMPLAKDAGTAVLPFQYDRLSRASRVVVEACPSSTLRRLELPRRGYKQPAGGPITAPRRAVRRTILAELARHVSLSAAHVRVMRSDPGGDALDAVLAAVGGLESFRATDHSAVAKDARAAREGWVFG